MALKCMAAAGDVRRGNPTLIPKLWASLRTRYPSHAGLMIAAQVGERSRLAAAAVLTPCWGAETQIHERERAALTQSPRGHFK